MLHPAVRNLIERSAVESGSIGDPSWPFVWLEDLVVGPQQIHVSHTDHNVINLESFKSTGRILEFHTVTLSGTLIMMSASNPRAYQPCYFGPCVHCGVNLFAAAVHPDDDWDIYVKELNKRKQRRKRR